jgi:type II secretory pathway pseudopilin PulG
MKTAPRFNGTTLQRFNGSPAPRFNGAEAPRFNDSTIQRFNDAAAPRFNASTLQRFNVPGARAAFTMIEIAISLAVIGFALVAIIGILPTAMQSQKDNRQETIINQDETIFMEAIKSGALGSDDLTNYVYAITNYSTVYPKSGGPTTTVFAYTRAGSWADAGAQSPSFPLTTGARIIGLLGTPRYIDISDNTAQRYVSNYVVAYVHSISGSADQKYPQTNQAMQDLSFNYRLVSEVATAAYYDREWTNFSAYPTNSPQYQTRLQYTMVATNLQQNLHDLRLVFRWPLFNNNVIGKGKQTYRTMVAGHMMRTNDGGYPPGISNLYYFQPRNYVKAP